LIRSEFMRSKTCKLFGVVLAALVPIGCDEGEKIPPSPGGAEARNQVEYPLGPPPAPKSVKAKKAGTPKEGPALPPDK
jgi:hypothetical protein